jgi:hypothetical protein
MSKIQVNEIVNHFDTGAPDCPKGLTVTGFSTFSGSASFSGDVSIGGTLTYEDVSNIDSVGLITARSGIHVTGTGSSVGIGTDSPEKKLHITGGSNAYDSVQIGAAGTDGLLIGNNSNNSNAAIFHQGNSANLEIGSQQFITINTGNIAGIASERIRVSSQGRVGIGQSSPITLLHVEGTESGAGEGLVRFRNNRITSGQPSWGLGITRQNNPVRAILLGSDDNNNAAICVNGNNSVIFGKEVSGTWTERMRIDTNGRVGINTDAFADTATALNIKNGASGSEHTFFDIECDNNETCRVRFSEDGSTYPGEIRYTHSDNSMRFYRGGTEHMRMDGSIRTFHSDASARFTIKNANTSSGSSAFDISNNASNVTNGTQVFSVRENGDIYTAGNTSVQALSSERRLKENIELIDRSVSWATIKNTPYYTYNLIGQEGPRYGPIVDEVPAEMVKETDLSDDQGPIRTFDNGMLNARLYVALQEAIAKIETLETKVAALEGN